MQDAASPQPAGRRGLLKEGGEEEKLHVVLQLSSLVVLHRPWAKCSSQLYLPLINWAVSLLSPADLSRDDCFIECSMRHLYSTAQRPFAATRRVK